MTKIIEWLRVNARGFKNLTDKEVSAISDFLFLWSLFEARVLNNEGSTSTICDAVDAWQNAGILDAQLLDPELTYFRQRYFANGAVTGHFEHLHLRRNDQEELIRAVIDGTRGNPRDRFAAVLIIIFRYRNNLFHGVKWRYDLADQLGNFTTANAALMKVLSRYGKLTEG